MARKNSQKTDTSGAIVFDSRTKAVMAQVGQDNVKEKVQAVKEVVPGRSNNEMYLVLQYYDCCVERTIQAYLEDGAKEALKEWNFTENKVSKHKKKKSKKNQSADQQKSNSQAQTNNNTNARLTNGIVNGHAPPGINSTNHIGKKGSRTGAVVSSSSSSSSLSRGESHVAAPASPKEDGSLEPASSLKDLNDSAAATGASKSESPTDNEKNTIQSPQLDAASPTPDTYHGSSSQESTLTAADLSRVRPGLEKSSKDLHRQTVALERLQLVLTDEVDKAYKRIKNVFEDMQTCLRERELQITKEMDLVKIDAMETLKSRQEKAVELREEIDQAPSMSESEVTDLRLQIKQFVSDRRIDDDLGRTTRFTYDSDRLAAEIKSFGEVIAVKCPYSSSRPSTSTSVSLSSISVSVSSSLDTLPPPIPAQVLSTSANISQQSNDTDSVLSSEGATSKIIPNSDQEISSQEQHNEIAQPVQVALSEESIPLNEVALSEGSIPSNEIAPSEESIPLNEKENSSPSPTKEDDLFQETNYRLLSTEETQAFINRRRSRRNYRNTGNREFSSRRGGSNQRGGRGGGRGAGSGGGGDRGGYSNSYYPQGRIQYLGRGARSRPYRGGGGEMRGGYSARPNPNTQTVNSTNK